MTERSTVSRAEFEALRREIDEIKQSQIDSAASAKTTHDMVQEMYDALMKPSPGQKRGFLDRAGEVVIQFESGKTVAGWIIGFGAFVAAIGAIGAAVWLRPGQ